jgi:hypothetical protein
VPFALVTGTMEELWFRKLLMDWAAGQGASAVLQILASAAVFGLAHGVWGLFAGNGAWPLARHSRPGLWAACLALFTCSPAGMWRHASGRTG